MCDAKAVGWDERTETEIQRGGRWKKKKKGAKPRQIGKETETETRDKRQRQDPAGDKRRRQDPESRGQEPARDKRHETEQRDKGQETETRDNRQETDQRDTSQPETRDKGKKIV